MRKLKWTPIPEPISIALFTGLQTEKIFQKLAWKALRTWMGLWWSVPFSEMLEITAAHFADYEFGTRAVLVHTGWDRHWNTAQYYEDHPYITEGAAVYLRDCKVRLIEIDAHNIDNTKGKSRPVHTTLLGANILIVEHLCNLNSLPKKDFTFSAVPPNWKGVGTFPVRAMAKIKYNRRGDK